MILSLRICQLLILAFSLTFGESLICYNCAVREFGNLDSTIIWNQNYDCRFEEKSYDFCSIILYYTKTFNAPSNNETVIVEMDGIENMRMSKLSKEARFFRNRHNRYDKKPISKPRRSKRQDNPFHEGGQVFGKPPTTDFIITALDITVATTNDGDKYYEQIREISYICKTDFCNHYSNIQTLLNAADVKINNNDEVNNFITNKVETSTCWSYANVSSTVPEPFNSFGCGASTPPTSQTSCYSCQTFAFTPDEQGSTQVCGICENNIEEFDTLIAEQRLHLRSQALSYTDLFYTICATSDCNNQDTMQQLQQEYLSVNFDFNKFQPTIVVPAEYTTITSASVTATSARVTATSPRVTTTSVRATATVAPVGTTSVPRGTTATSASHGKSSVSHTSMVTIIFLLSLQTIFT
ncbi:unnamed protein product [Didymodactylos carnosus]|uniref:Uncharacterized protein n=1 Tax=Didymodactylos carnosus TaxID=1234261 RepID=A0A8S2P090_9BILA|nr:unnamed protein product [Didymodactylos carnosus]CAF4026050.1 unnamed protein product [Didymodactylos carnosus]